MSSDKGRRKNDKPRLLVLGEPDETRLIADWEKRFEVSSDIRAGQQPDLMVACLWSSNRRALNGIERARRKYPSVPLVAVVRADDARLAVAAASRGASEIMIYPTTGAQLFRVYQRLRFITGEDGALCERLVTASGAERVLITRSPSMIRTLEIARRAAETSATVLITGESGTGKELLAAYIHAKSPRANAPFYAVNCAALPIELAESELFGHERGAFTGAVEMRRGKFELSDGGTLLLDEIGELDVRLQAKLLRVLEDGLVWRLGASRPVQVDVRVIATTNADLARMASEGKFREDLFYRLEVISINIPPLRERREDIETLARHFLRESCSRFGKPGLALSDEAVEVLESHSWPGNVRELQNTMERAALLCDADEIGPQHIIFDRTAAPANRRLGEELPLNLDELERLAIERALQVSGGNRTNAAKLLGITVRTLRNKLARYREKFSHRAADSAVHNASFSGIYRANIAH